MPPQGQKQKPPCFWFLEGFCCCCVFVFVFSFFFFFLFFLLGRLQGLMLVTLLHPHLEERKTVDKVPLEKSLQRLWQQK